MLREVLEGETPRSIPVLAALTVQPKSGEIAHKEGAIVVAGYLDRVSVVGDRVLVVTVFFDQQLREFD